MKINTTEVLAVNQLKALGIPLDGEVIANSGVAGRGLEMVQEPNLPETYVFDLNSGGTGLVLSLMIVNDLGHSIRLKAARLQIPWCDQIHWLADPRQSVPRDDVYWFSEPGGPGFERSGALNHFFGAKGDLLPGDRVRGFLLGTAEELIPSHYENRQSFRATLSVFDGQKNVYPLELKFQIQRIRELHEQQKAAASQVAADRVTKTGSVAAAVAQACYIIK